MLPQTIPKSADKILGSNPTQSSSSSSTSQPENQTVSKTFEVYLSVTALSKKLMALAFSANSEDPAQRDAQLQLLMDKLKQWTDDLNDLSAKCGSVSTIPDCPVSTILAPTVQNGLSVMPGRMLMQKLCTGEQSISRAAINIGTTANVRVVQAPHPTTLASAPPPRLRPAAFRISDGAGAGVCGITVGRASTAKVQQRRERLLVRRIPPSNAYLSAGSKLYQQHQQQQHQHQPPRVPPSNAYLSAGTKLAIRQQQMQQQRLKRLQHHLAGIGSSSSTAGGISSTSATTASSFSSTSSSATAPIALTLRSALVQQKPAGNIEQMQTEQQ